MRALRNRLRGEAGSRKNKCTLGDREEGEVSTGWLRNLSLERKKCPVDKAAAAPTYRRGKGHPNWARITDLYNLRAGKCQKRTQKVVACPIEGNNWNEGKNIVKEGGGCFYENYARLHRGKAKSRLCNTCFWRCKLWLSPSNAAATLFTQIPDLGFVRCTERRSRRCSYKLITAGIYIPLKI